MLLDLCITVADGYGREHPFLPKRNGDDANCVLDCVGLLVGLGCAGCMRVVGPGCIYLFFRHFVLTAGSKRMAGLGTVDAESYQL